MATTLEIAKAKEITKVLNFIPVAQSIANLSKDRKRKVGAIILGPSFEIRSTGYNGFPKGVREDLEERHETPEKFFWTSHAEENAIAQAAYSGVSLKGCTILVTELFPCATCSRLIIQSGIVKVYSRVIHKSAKWDAEAFRASKMFDEAGLEVHKL